MESYLAPTHTRADPIVLYVGLRSAGRALWGTEPDRACLLILAAQWALETNTGDAWMNWNVGGVKHRTGDGRDWTSYPTKELEGGRYVVHSGREDPATWFRAFATMEEGIADYLVTLQHDFPRALERAHAGDAPGFVRELAAARYFTAPMAQYLSGLYARRDHLEAVLGRDTSRDLGADVDEAIAQASVEALARAGLEGAAVAFGGAGDDNDPQPTPPEDLPPAPEELAPAKASARLDASSSRECPAQLAEDDHGCPYAGGACPVHGNTAKA